MTLWFRYLFSRLAKTFLFLLFCIFSIYVIVDLSVNSVRFFSSGGTTFIEISLYYLRNFAKHLELFFPLSFLLSAMKVLFDLNAYRELVALQMAGLSKKKLLSPFYLFAILLSSVCYINCEWIAPDAQDSANEFRSAHAKKKKKKREHLFTLSLEDETELIYQSFDPSEKQLFDVYWICSADDIWHMKYLKIDPKPPSGRHVDRLTRNEMKQFEKKESFDKRDFPELSWDDDGAALQRFVPFENRSLSNLYQQARSNSADKQSLFTHLHYKLALPMLSFLAILAISPFSMRFSRSLPVFLFASLSLFGFIALCTILDGMLILGENKVLPPYIAIWGPLLLSFGLAARPFIKL